MGCEAASRHPLARIAAESRATFVRGTVASVSPAGHRVSCAGGPDLGYDNLLLASGARMQPPFADAIAFGIAGSGQAVKRMLSRLRSEGQGRRALGGHARGPSACAVRRSGKRQSRPIAGGGGIEFIGATEATVRGGQATLGATGEAVAADCVVTLPLLSGPGLADVPATQPHGFVPVDEYGRVERLADVYTAGDSVDFPTKQGGLAAQQAGTVAARHGAPVDPVPFLPLLRGMLFTGAEPQFMRSDLPGTAPEIRATWYPLWWPPTKIAGRYLAPYLIGRGESEGLSARPEAFVDVLARRVGWELDRIQDRATANGRRLG